MKGPLNSSVTFDEDNSSVEENQLKRYLQRRILFYQKNHLGVDLSGESSAIRVVTVQINIK